MPSKKQQQSDDDNGVPLSVPPAERYPDGVPVQVPRSLPTSGSGSNGQKATATKNKE